MSTEFDVKRGLEQLRTARSEMDVSIIMRSLQDFCMKEYGKEGIVTPAIFKVIAKALEEVALMNLKQQKGT